MFRVHVVFKGLGSHMNGEFRHLLTLKAISLGGYDLDNTFEDNGAWAQQTYQFQKRAQATVFNAWVLEKEKIIRVEYHNLALEVDNALAPKS